MSAKAQYEENRRVGLAAKALQGLLSNTNYRIDDSNKVARNAVEYADALLVALGLGPALTE